MKDLRPVIKTCDDLDKWCAMPKGELQHHIARCVKIMAELTDFVNHDQYLSHLKDAKYIWYNVEAFPVKPCKCDVHAVGMVHCTGST